MPAGVKLWEIFLRGEQLQIQVGQHKKHELFDATDSVAPPQALVEPSAPWQAIVLQSFPILIEIFLL